MTDLEKALFWITPLIATLVVANQFYRVQTYDLSTWQGGGFGMFSSVDTVYSRFFKIYLLIDDEIVPVKIKGSFQKLSMIARAEPTQENLRNLAQRIYQANWVRSGLFKFDPSASDNYRPVLEIKQQKNKAMQPEHDVKVDGIILEMWKTKFDSKTSTVSAYKHTEYVYSLDNQ